MGTGVTYFTATMFGQLANRDAIGCYLFYLGLLEAAWTTVTGSIFALDERRGGPRRLLTSPFLLLIAIGMAVMLNKRQIMEAHVNDWKQNLALGLIILFVAVAAYRGLTSAVHMVA